MNRTCTPRRAGLLGLPGLILLAAAPALAQEGAPEPGEPGLPAMTLPEALDRALARSPQVAQSRQQVENAQVAHRSAWGAFLPTLSGSAGGSLRSSERFDSNTDRVVTGSADSYNAGLSARYTIFSGGSRFRDLDAASADITAAEARLEDQRFGVALQVKNAFFQALRQEELLEVARARIDQAEQSLGMTRRQAQLGQATSSDTLQTRLALLNGRQAVLAAETALRAARMNLGRLVGEAGPVDPVAPEDLAPTPLPMADEEILELAVQASPSVVAAEATTLAARAAVSAARASYLPSVSVSSGYNWANQAASFGGGTTSWNLGLSLSYPIFNGFQRESGVARADNAWEVARYQEEDARLAARAEADAALQALRTAGLAIEIAEEALAVAREDMRVVQERFRVGVARVIDVITSQVALDQARVDLVQARYDYLIAEAELEAILGREL